MFYGYKGPESYDTNIHEKLMLWKVRFTHGIIIKYTFATIKKQIQIVDQNFEEKKIDQLLFYPVTSYIFDMPFGHVKNPNNKCE